MSQARSRAGRVATGVPGFDKIVEGGLPEGRLYIVSGPPGSGKTTFCSQFVTQGARRGDTCLYVTMHETEDELVKDMGRFDFGFDRAMEQGAIQFLDLLDEHRQMEIAGYGGDGKLGDRLGAYLKKNSIDLAVIDSTMLLKHFMRDIENEITDFLTALKGSGTTILLISEMTDPSSYSDEHYLAHGVIFFHNFLNESGMTRGVQVIKMRGTHIDCDIREIDFSDRGLTVFPDRKLDT